jgi:hypothetical protein
MGDARQGEARRAPVALPLNRAGAFGHSLVILGAVSAIFGSPWIVLSFVNPDNRLVYWWLVAGSVIVVLAFGLAVVGWSAVVTWVRGRPPLVIDEDGVSVRGRRLAWDGVAGVYVRDGLLTFDLTHDELDRRGMDWNQGMALENTNFTLPLAWTTADGDEILACLRPFLNPPARRGTLRA